MTPTRSLALGLDTGLRALDEAGQSFDFVVASPSTANFDFSHEGADTSFDVGARIRSRRVDFFGPIDIDGPLPDDLTGFQEDSIEYRSDADIGFAVGTNSPSTYEFNLAATNFDYSEDTGTENLVPRRSVQGDAIWTLQITPVFATVAGLGYYWYSADNTTDEEITVAEGDFGIAYTPTENFRIRGGLGYADRKRDQTIAGVRDTTEHNTGPVIRGDLRYVQEDFTLIGEARWTTAAPEDRLSGVVRGFYNLPRGRISGRVFQRYGGGQGGSDSRVTGAGIGLTHEHHHRLEPRLRRLLRHPGRRGRSRRARHRPHRPDRELHPQPDRDGQRPDRLRLPPPGRGPRGRDQQQRLPDHRQDLRDRSLRTVDPLRPRTQRVSA